VTEGVEPSRPGAPGAHTAVSGDGRLFRADRDQHITEYHTHYSAALGSLPGPERSGPDSVRVPLTPPLVGPLRDRRELRDLLTRAVSAGEGGAVHVLHGMAGCGKTALAQTIFDEAVGSYGVTGLWVNASGITPLRAGMLAVAHDRGASQEEVDAAQAGRRPAADLVWHYLDRSPERWLLVLDNADDPGPIQEGGWLRSSPQGTVVVTTRQGSAPAWRRASRHHLGMLGVADAVDVLRDFAADDEDRASVELLARRLGCHPLALMLAGTFLGHQLLEPITMDEYVERLEGDPSTVLDLGADPAERDVRRLLSSTWQVSLDALAAQGRPEATTLLRLLSCYASEPLPVGVLSPAHLDATGLPQADPPLQGDAANGALQGLLSQSLVSVLDIPGDPGQSAVRSVQTHGLLLDTVAARIPLDQRDTVFSAAADLLARFITPGDGQYVDAQTLRLFGPHATALLRRVTGAGSSAADRALTIVRRLRAHSYERGDYHTAHALAADAAAVTRNHSTADALTDQYALARSLNGLGRFAEASDLHGATLRSREELLGADHVQTLDSAHALAISLYGLGLWAEDEQHMRRAVEGRERVLGSDHPDTLDSRGRLAEAVGQQGRWPEAEDLARSNLAASERALGTDHPHTLLSRIALAWVLAGIGQWGEAEAHTRATLEASEQTLGPDHPRTLAARHRLASVLSRRGQWAQAEEMARAVCDVRERILGPEHPHTLSIQIELTRILAGAGQHSAARTLAAPTLEACVRVLGPEHPDTVACRAVTEELASSDTDTHGSSSAEHEDGQP
jgi:tetratricopeptide (TPR) repeat protein